MLMPDEQQRLVAIKLHGAGFNAPCLWGAFDDANELVLVKAGARHWTRREDETAEEFHGRVVADVRAAAE